MKKVLLILVDGMRPDGMEQIEYAHTCIRDGMYAPHATTVMPSVTLPCHMSLFHSVDPGRHGITTNFYMPQVRPVKGLIDVLHDHHKKSAQFFNWEELRDLSRPGAMTYSTFVSGHDFGYEFANNEVTDRCIDLLNRQDMDFTFLYLGMVDEKGHGYGWMSPEYIAAIRQSFDMIRRVRENLKDEYDIIITADHGGHDRGHGMNIPEDMTIPMIFIGKDFTPGSTLEEANIMDIAPTILHLLGVEKPEEWEGKCLL